MNFNFNSQISTTREQSKKLIELGVNEYTADMYFTPYVEKPQTISFFNAKESLKRMLGDFPFTNTIQIMPSWSLHRLISLLDRDGYHIVLDVDNPFDDVIERIEYKINNNTFNKDYLK